MDLIKVALPAITAVFLVGCGTGPDDSPTGSVESAIVRGTVDDAHPQVVRLTAELPWGSTVGCTGTYIAPRVVLTAAHCVPDPLDAAYGGRILVYHGNSFNEEYAALTEVPPPGADSPWSLADSWEAHPAYDPGIVYPDLAIVYLDRELPMKPLPIAPYRLRDNRIGELFEIVGYGASKAFSADIQDNEGGGIKRSGQVPFMGSPPQYPKPDDPHPGLDLAEVRSALAMFNGADPWPNGCAGDSGGPVLDLRGRRQEVFGVASWTANYCEGFSYYTRLDPFLPYLVDSLRRAGWAPLKPTLDCVAEGENGQLTAYLGYDNQNGISLDVPLGRRNSLPQDEGQIRPTHFKPGKQSWVFSIDFSTQEVLTYTLKGRVGAAHRLRVDASSPRCDPNDTAFVLNNYCERAAEMACMQKDSCMVMMGDTSWLLPECVPAYNDWLRCETQVPPEEYDCSMGYPYSMACMDFDMAIWTCMGF